MMVSLPGAPRRYHVVEIFFFVVVSFALTVLVLALLDALVFDVIPYYLLSSDSLALKSSTFVKPK